MRPKKKILVAAIALSSAISGSAYALVVPASDMATTAQVMTGNQQDAQIAQQEEQTDREAMDQAKQIGEKTIDAVNNSAANMIVRTTQTATDLYNMQALKESVPAISSCSTSADRFFNELFECTESESATAEMDSLNNERNTIGMTKREQIAHVASLYDEVYASCNALDGDSGIDGSSGSLCSNAGIFHGTNVGTTRDPVSQQASDEYVKLLLGVAPEITEGVKDPSNMTRDEIRDQVRTLEKNAIWSLAANSLVGYNNMLKGPGVMEGQANPSEMTRLEKFDQDRWGNEVWLRKINNTPLIGNEAQEQNAVMETQLLREITVMNAFQIHLTLKQYQQSLRDETLQATMLRIMNDNR